METAPKRVVGRPFQKGQSGNPAGRAKGPRLSTLILQGLAKAAPGARGTEAEVVAEKLVALALAGDLGAIKEVLDRAEGKSVARAENGQPGDFDLDLDDVETRALKAALTR